MRIKRSLTGFAFIEFLVDLALIAILIGVIVVYYKNMEKKVYSRVALREIRMLKIAVTSYYENKEPKAYPPAMDNLCANYLLAAKPRIIKEILYDPFARKNQEYHYALSANGKFYCIWSIGMNRNSDIQGIDDEGNVIMDKKCDDLYVTPTIDIE